MNLLSDLKAAALLWYNQDADLMAATVAYYALFAMAPLLLLTVSLLGVLVGDQVVSTELLRWGSLLGPEMLSLLTEAVQNLDALSVDLGIPLVGAIFFSGMVVVLCNTFTTGLHQLWGIRHQGIIGWFKKCLHSVIFIVALEIYLLALVAINASVMQFADLIWGPMLVFYQLIFTIAMTTFLFSFMYGLLPWEAPRVRARLYGAFVASSILVLAKFGIVFYVNSTPLPGLYGAAGLILILLIWVYVITAIVYYGAALAHVADHTDS